MDIGNVSFPFVFRTGKEGDTLKSEDTTFTLKGCPVLCDKAANFLLLEALLMERTLLRHLGIYFWSAMRLWSGREKWQQNHI